MVRRREYIHKYMSHASEIVTNTFIGFRAQDIISSLSDAALRSCPV